MASKARKAAISDACCCFNLRRASRLVTQIYDETLRPSGIRATQFTLLAMVRGKGSLSVNELAELALTDRTTLTRNLRPLERDGLIETAPGDDQRVREISITAKGERVLGRALPLWERAQERVRARLGGANVERLVRDLRTAVAGLQSD